MANFQFVKQFGGHYIPLNQLSLKEHYERIAEQSFTGVCAGAVAMMIEKLVEPPPSYSARLYRPATSSSKVTSNDKCVFYQMAYERDNEHFFTRLMRDLRINPTGHADAEYYCNHINQFIDTIKVNGDKVSQVSLVTLRYDFTTDKTTTQQLHMMMLLKQKGQWLCYDPNLGIAIFNHAEQYSAWLEAEIKGGALQVFTHPVSAHLLVNTNNKQAQLQQGVLSMKSIYVENYTYPTPGFSQRPQLEGESKVARL